MAVKDFQAKQIRANRIIGSGSDEAQPSVMIYSASAASDMIGGLSLIHI